MAGFRIYGVGAVLLGAVCLIFSDFALQWQPVPRGWSGREALALLSAAGFLAAGAAIQMRRWRGIAGAALAAMFGLWIVLHAPAVMDAPADIGAWNGVAESLALASAGAALWLDRRGGPRAAGLVVRAFGLCPLVFGAAHFAYADFTASMVPAWIPPGQHFWAYATGACHVAAGLAIVSGLQARLGARLLGVMFAGFVLLLHIPRVMADPASQLEWTMAAVALSLTGAAWTIADQIAAGARRDIVRVPFQGKSR